jgi:hypothetical protein
MKKLLFIFALVFLASFAFGQANVADVDQWGSDNIVTIKQVGGMNYAYALEDGMYNTLWMCQTGYYNVELAYVYGNDNSIWYPGCWGWGGFFMYWPQTWCCFGFKVYTFFCYDPTNVMHQWGTNNYAKLWIDYADWNRVAQTQLGHFNGMELYISGDANFSMQYQWGASNWSFVNIMGYFGRVLSYQHGYSNAAFVNQWGMYNDAAILQDGNYHVATIEQHMGSYGNLAIINQFDCHYWQPIYVGMCCPCPHWY